MIIVAAKLPLSKDGATDAGLSGPFEGWQQDSDDGTGRVSSQGERGDGTGLPLGTGARL